MNQKINSLKPGINIKQVSMKLINFLTILCLCFFLYFTQLFSLAYGTPPSDKDIENIGLRVTALMKAFQGDREKNANIFVPVIRSQANAAWHYLEWENKICVFASGGLKNAWEETVAQTYNVLYNQEIEIIRGAWVMKYANPRLMDNLKDSKEDLHAEFLFTQATSYIEKNITHIRGFSFWKPCNKCRAHLLSTKSHSIIQFTKPYDSVGNKYEDNERFKTKIILEFPKKEEVIWQNLWEELRKKTNRHFTSDEEKETYWSKTVEGINLSKWISQVFESQLREHFWKNTEEKESQIVLNPSKVSPYWSTVASDDKEHLRDLMILLRRVNWEFSCWYHNPYLSPFQKNWERHWKYTVVPHFEWELVGGDQVMEEEEIDCEMCGHRNLRNLCYLYHPKHRPIEEKNITQKEKKEKSLTVGTDCCDILQWQKEKVEDMVRQKCPEAKRIKENEDLQKAEKILSQQKKEKRKSQNEAKKIKQTPELHKSFSNPPIRKKARRLILSQSSEEEDDNHIEQDDSYSLEQDSLSQESIKPRKKRPRIETSDDSEKEEETPAKRQMVVHYSSS